MNTDFIHGFLFISVYEMVSFSHTPYNTAISCIESQDELLGTIMSSGDFFKNIEEPSFSKQLDSWMNNYYQAVQQLDFGHEIR